MLLRRYDLVSPTKATRARFDCGYSSLDRWLAEQARQSLASRDAVTYLLMDESTIAGYFCLSAGSVSREDATHEVARRAPQPIPVVRMGRFAIDRRYQGLGWGTDLLAEALRAASGAIDVIGARAMVVDAIDDHAKGFYLRNGFTHSVGNPSQLMVRLEVVQASQVASSAARRPPG